MKKLVVIGDPVSHSLSPLIHNAALKTIKLDNDFYYEKQRMKRQELADFIENISARGIVGGNVILPHKEHVVEYAEELTQEAALMGAVNTLFTREGKIIGHNTDGIGFLTSLKENNLSVTQKKIVILGAGGTVRAITFTLTKYNLKELVILNRTVKRAKTLSKDVEEKTGKKVRSGNLNKIEEELKDTDILINCTSIGMVGEQENRTLATWEMLTPNTVVMDVVYTPLKTKLLKEAEDAGCKTVDGTSMFIHQASPSFKIWTGKSPPLEAMRRALLTHLRGVR